MGVVHEVARVQRKPIFLAATIVLSLLAYWKNYREVEQLKSDVIQLRLQSAQQQSAIDRMEATLSLQIMKHQGEVLDMKLRQRK